MVKSELIQAIIGVLGYELVDIEWGSGGVLRVYIDLNNAEDRKFIILEDCEQVSRQLKPILEAEGVEYNRLEISSPGLNRPLRSASALDRFCGHCIEIVFKSTAILTNTFELQRRYFGRLSKIHLTNDKWRLELLESAKTFQKNQKVARWKSAKEPKFIEFSWADVDSAKLAEDRLVD